MNAAFIFAALAVPARATTDAYPALYDVIDVAADDVLNIRAEPDIGSPIIGTLAPDATDIEVIRPSDDFEWARIVTGEGMGWVSLRYIVPQPGQWDGRFPEFTRCAGTEPFWSLSRDDGTMTFSGIDLETISAPTDNQTSPLSHRGRHGFAAGPMVGILSNQLCTDGMSDIEYGWELNLLFPASAEHYQGCCTLRPPAE